MAFVRLCHPKHYEKYKQRFKSLAFKLSSEDGGASTFDRDCGIATSGTLCAHIARFYPNVGGDPAVFRIFEPSELPNSAHFDREKSDSGDECHHNVRGVTNNQLKKVLEDWGSEGFQICDGSGQRDLTSSDIAAF